jgi:uncharacterized protein (DUF58 family)
VVTTSTELAPDLPPEEMLARVRRLQIRARRLVRMLFFGEYHSVFRGKGIEFSEVREYLPGDEVWTIDWNVTARMGAPYVKKFVEERELTVYFLVDLSASGSFSTTLRPSASSRLKWPRCWPSPRTSNNDKVGLIAFTDRVELYLRPRRGQHHVLRMARDLIYHPTRSRGTNVAVAVDLSCTSPRPGVAFLISDFHAQAFESSLAWRPRSTTSSRSESRTRASSSCPVSAS